MRAIDFFAPNCLVTLDGNEIRQVAEFVQRLAVAVDNGDIVAITTQHTRQVATHLSDS